MSKRRRTSSIASRGHEEDSLDSLEASTSSGPTMRKRSKKQDPMELCQQLYDTIRTHKKEDGTLLCDSFIRVPKRRQEPGYYEVVTNPMDLLKVQQKLKTDEYEDIDDLQNDIELIVSNTKAFYKKNSQEHRDALDLWSLFLSNKNRLLNFKEEEVEVKTRYARSKKRSLPEKMDIDHSEDTSESSANLDEEVSVYEELFTAVMTATDSDNKPLHTVFQLLPSKKKYPEYYEHIDNPIDLKMIAQMIQNNDYLNLGELEKDLILMTNNACLFNEPGSQIYKNAKALKKIIQSKKIEVEHAKSATGKSSERIRNKRLRGSTCLSAVTAALRDEESDTEMEPEESLEDEQARDPADAENPQWILFDTIKNATNNTGQNMSEPFWKLPSKRFYADYYKEIKNPLSLTQIRKKLQNKQYGTLSEVAGDMTIMFENAKKYNVPSSKLYKDAVKLQKIMQGKVQELLDINQVKTRVTNKTLKDTDSEIESEEKTRRKPGPKPKNPPPVITPTRGRLPKDTLPLKKKLHAIAKHLLDFSCEDGRQPMLGFMEKPSKKLYPDYYEVIQEPIDYMEIESKIKADQYSSESDLVKDFKLMFANCRQYNEENSPIYEDSNILEKYLLDKVAQTVIVTPEKKEKAVVKTVRPRKINPPIDKNLRMLYDTIRDYREPKANRQLALIFMKLPSKNDYPDYYEVIKNPMDMEKIAQKLKTSCYDSVDDLASDFILTFDNACKYNEPDSQIYKDALVLQRVCLQTKLQLKESDENVPDVQAAVNDILLNLFTNVYNHQDVDERCYSDSLAELPEHDEIDGKKVRALSMDLIKRRLDKGLYKRLDVFQDDFFACLDRARRLSRTDSQVFEDSVEMQSFFIKQRDELCKHGELLQSTALNYTLADLTSAVEALKQSKLLQESLEEETETRSSDDSIIKETTNMSMGESMTCNQQTYKVGEFVYMESKEKGCEPHILLIERLWSNNGQQMLYGNFYLRPAETYHLTTRKFLEKEVFKSDCHVATPLEDVKDRCCVLSVKQYFTMKPEGYEEKDIYVCESRYSTKARCFKKIKIFPENPNLKLVPREVPLEPKRVVSVFRERVEKHKDELAELQEQERLIEKEKPNVVTFADVEMDNGNTYYEQYNTVCSGVVKTGDFVYVAADGGKQMIAQICSIWDTPDGKCYFRGPWFVTPSEIPHHPSKTFYKQEMFLSSMEDTHPIVGIVGRCSVLDYNDYISCRPTEIPENDVFVCTSIYDEMTRQTRKLLADGLKKVAHSPQVTEDEVYYFTRIISPPRATAVATPTIVETVKPAVTPMEVDPMTPQQVTKLTDMDILIEDSMDGGPPSVGSGEMAPATPVSSSVTATPLTSKKKPQKNKVVTGYILYSREYRKQIVQNNPESKFGEISRIVGVEWRSLPAHEKQMWEEKASKMNEETKANLLLEEQCASPAASPAPAPPNPDMVYECQWDKCDFQFEELSDCLEHCVKDRESQGHVQAYFQANPDAELQCQWKTCLRHNKKNLQPFPNLARLVRHVRDMHINKGNGRVVPPSERSKNFKPSSKPTSASRTTASTAQNPSTSTPPAASPPVPQKQQEPIFISVPPRPQRVLHSEAYIKYIEGLQVDNKFISPWEKVLHANQENTPVPDAEKLQNVTTWLGKKADQQENVVSALWALRNQLMKDTLGLYKRYT
ncbi:protein polybromo-1 isoform X2 [Harmonia axyridis]|uniref:protein polybromo-1 isoform X2 n=1 Tax=Harmonia axyridis TaxID=115357 RepID=UPI001E277FA5|nr:protein polybromo-1 isoform X2 [Harmonia axyridis]